MKEQPKFKDKNYAEIGVTRTGNHSHVGDAASNQLRGEERERVAEQCMLQYNGSAFQYAKTVANEVDDEEEMTEYKQKLLQNVVRKAVHEYMNKDMVSTCWITNCNLVIDTLKVTVPGTELPGFVQRFQVNKKIEIHVKC